MRRRRHSQVPPLPHSQAPRSPPFPVPVKAPPLSSHCIKGPAPHMLIGLGCGGGGGAKRKHWGGRKVLWSNRRGGGGGRAPLLSAARQGSERFLYRHGSHSPAKTDTDTASTLWGFCFVPFLPPCSSPLTHPGFSQGISDSQEKQQKPTEYKRIKSFIAFRAVVIGLGRWDDLGGTSRHLTVEVDGDCRGGWRLWPRGRVVPTSPSPAVSAPSVGNQ